MSPVQVESCNPEKKMSNQQPVDKLAEEVEEKVTFKPKLNPFASSFAPNLSAPAFVPGATAFAASPPPLATVASENKDLSPKKQQQPPANPTRKEPEQKTEEKPAVQAAARKPAPVTQTASLAAELTAEEREAEEEFFQEKVKDNLNIVFIGHVDAGKSTMGGHLLFLTGMVDKRTMEKYEKEAREQNRESWYLSWALDTNAEERAKGKTVECGRASFETEKRRFTILDAPGHKNYVPNMISGASQADVGVLVISARKGEFETGFEKGGQTREHAMLAKTAGVKKLIVVINKMDDTTVAWSEERYRECCDKLIPFLKSCGYNVKTDVLFMPVSGYTGANLKDRLEKSVCSWYDGPSLIEYLDNVDGLIDRNKATGAFMMPLTEKYRDMGTVVAGKIESGRIRKGKNMIVMPNKKACEVQAIFGEDEEELKTATCGDNVRMRLRGVEEEEVSVGFVLCDINNPVKTAQVFEAQLMILEHKNIMCAGYTCVLHIHTCVEEVTIGALLHLIDKKTGRRSKRPPPFAKKGQIVVARIEATGPVCMETYEDYPQLGRFTLRDEGKTVAMGKVTRLVDSTPAIAN